MILAKLPEKIIYLGMDLLGSLGIGVIGLDQMGEDQASESFQEDQELLSTHGSWPKEDLIEDSLRQELLTNIDPEIQGNKNIPLGVFCSHPSAMIKIDTAEALPIYQRQYT